MPRVMTAGEEAENTGILFFISSVLLAKIIPAAITITANINIVRMDFLVVRCVISYPSYPTYLPAQAGPSYTEFAASQATLDRLFPIPLNPSAVKNPDNPPAVP